MERLSHIIYVEVKNKMWEPIQLGKRCPLLSHLDFVDDLILFVEASMDQVEVINDYLDFFCESSMGRKSE